MALNNTDFQVKIEYETSNDDFFISEVESLNEEASNEDFNGTDFIKEEPGAYEVQIEQSTEYNSVTKGPSEIIETKHYQDNMADSTCNTLNGMEKYDCHLCNKKLITQYHLELHMKTHMEETHNVSSKSTWTENDTTIHVKVEYDSNAEEFINKNECLKEEVITKEDPYNMNIVFIKEEPVDYELRIDPPIEYNYSMESSLFDLRTSNNDDNTPASCNTLNEINMASNELPCNQNDKKFKENKRTLATKDNCHPKQSGPYICDVCDKKYRYKSLLIEHMRAHTGERPFTCKLCSKKFTHRSCLHVHMKIHSGEKQNACYICDKKFVRKYDLKVHIRTHTGERPYGCILCPKRFISKCALNEHKRTHLEKKCKQTLHEIIPVSTTADKEIENSVKHDSIPIEKILVTIKTEPDVSEEYVIEKQDFVKKDVVKRESVLTMVKSGRLVHKSREYSSNSTHSLSNSDQSTDSFQCDVCTKTFTTVRNLSRHKITHSENRCSYTCKVCNQTYLQKKNLTVHMRTHTGERPFACSMCDKTFRQNCDLIKHTRTHTGEKPYSCQVCDKKFSQKYNLQVHTKTHTGERSYACDECEKTYRVKSALIRHKNTHTISMKA